MRCWPRDRKADHVAGHFSTPPFCCCARRRAPSSSGVRSRTARHRQPSITRWFPASPGQKLAITMAPFGCRSRQCEIAGALDDPAVRPGKPA